MYSNSLVCLRILKNYFICIAHSYSIVLLSLFVLHFALRLWCQAHSAALSKCPHCLCTGTSGLFIHKHKGGSLDSMLFDVVMILVPCFIFSCY
jgi:hypothetical protein